MMTRSRVAVGVDTGGIGYGKEVSSSRTWNVPPSRISSCRLKRKLADVTRPDALMNSLLLSHYMSSLYCILYLSVGLAILGKPVRGLREQFVQAGVESDDIHIFYGTILLRT